MTENQLPIFFRYRFWWHLLFWVVVLVVFWLIYAGLKGQFYQEFIFNLVQLPAKMVGTYTFIYLVLPLATKKKKFVGFGILVFIHFLLFGLILRASVYLFAQIPGLNDFRKFPFFDMTRILTKAASDYVLPGIAAAIYIFKRWYLDELKNKKLMEEKLVSELNFLKSQIHPHFLFNTLNNLYALTLIKSDKTPDIVLKLSELLNYMIYKSNDEFVMLAKELEIIEGYIEIEKMRYNERLELTYLVKGETNDYQIAPLILLPFIENCFKHGASQDRIKPVIHIEIHIEPAFVYLKAVNSIPEKNENYELQGEGIGLRNVKRRLDLIYPGKYVLEIKPSKKLFEVELKIFRK